jgi:hypothetical protein
MREQSEHISFRAAGVINGLAHQSVRSREDSFAPRGRWALSCTSLSA